MDGVKAYCIVAVSPACVILKDLQSNQQLAPFPSLDIRRGSSTDLYQGMRILFHSSVGFMDEEYYQSDSMVGMRPGAGELVWLVFQLGRQVGLRGNRGDLQRFEAVCRLVDGAESKLISSQDIDQYAGLEAQIRMLLQTFSQKFQSEKYKNMDYTNVNWDLHCLASFFSTCIVQVDENRQIRHFPDTVQTTVPFLYYTPGGKSADVSLAPHGNLFPRDNTSPSAVQEALEGLVVAACADCGQDGVFSLPCGDTLCGHCVKSSSEGCLECPKHKLYYSLAVLKPQLPESFPTSRACAVCAVGGDEVSNLVELAEGKVLKLDCGDSLCLAHTMEMLVKGKRDCLACGLLHSLPISDFPLVSCWKCGKNKAICAFSPISCPASTVRAHYLCQDCLSSSLLQSSCDQCHRLYSDSERQYAQKSLCCQVCDQPPAQLFTFKGKLCDCVICFHCAQNYTLETLNILHCPGKKAGCRYSESLVRTLSQSLRCVDFEQLMREEGENCEDNLKSYEIERSNWKKGRNTCPFCYDPLIRQRDTKEIGIFEVSCIGLCGHNYHKECLARYLEDELLKIVDNRRPEYPKCPNPCGTDIDGNLIGGRLPLVTSETSDKFNRHQAEMTFRLFECNCSTDIIEIPKDAKFVVCSKGTEHCVTCKGLGTAATHNDRDCLFYMQERKLNEYLSILCPDCKCVDCQVSQCPNCLEPAIKSGCDTFTCKNCGKSYCFSCSVLTSTIVAHKGKDEEMNLWHRPQCSHYKRLSEEEVRAKLEREEMKPECPQCLKLGRRCEPPANLRTKHRFSLEEWRVQQG